MHGQEIRAAPGAERTNVAPPADLDEARRRLAAAIRSNDPLLFEDKGGALVLHFRQHPDQRERAATLARDAAHGLKAIHVVAGHDIFEVLERGVTKARAIEHLSTHPPFAGRIPVYVGDDTTDEDAIRAAQEAGGFGVKVGPGHDECGLPPGGYQFRAPLARSACGLTHAGTATLTRSLQ